MSSPLSRELLRSPVISAVVATMAIMVFACDERSPEAPAAEPRRQVDALVASFRVVTEPGGVETIERIAVHQGKVRIPDEKDVWRLFDIAEQTITTVDEIGLQVDQTTFTRVLSGLRSAARQPTAAPMATVRAGNRVASIAGFEARQYLLRVGRGYEREIFVSDRPIVHSDFFLLRLATDPIDRENLPPLRNLIRLLDDLDGYPVIDRSRMTLDEVDYTIERTLIAVSDQEVPASWFELPDWAVEQLKAPPAGPPPAASPPNGQSAREEESRSSG